MHSDLLPRGLRHRWWIYLLAINCAFLPFTFYAGGAFPYSFFVRPLALSTEQGVGTWWSGFQLLLFSLLARSLALDLRQTMPEISRGLALMSVIGLLLFVDEMGSIHERVTWFVPLPKQLALLPLAVLGAILFFWGMYLLLQRRDVVRKAPWMIVTAFLLFACVFLLELAEHGFTWSSAVWRGLRFAIEEGLELAGGLLLIASMVHVQQSLGVSRPDLSTLLPKPEALRWLCTLCLYAAIPIWLLRAMYTVDELQIPLKGDFGTVIPIGLFIVAALSAMRIGLVQQNHRFAWWLLAGILLLVSLDLQCHFHHYPLYDNQDIRWRSDLGLLWSTPLLLWGPLAIPTLRTPTLLGGLAANYLLVLASVWLDFAPLALATPYVVAFLMAYVLVAYAEHDPLARSEAFGESNDGAWAARAGD